MIQDVTPEMAKRLEEVAEKIEMDLEERKQLIFAAHSDGDSLRVIAEKVGMSWSGVRKIIHQGKGTTP